MTDTALAEIMEEFEDALAPDIFSDPNGPGDVNEQDRFIPTTDAQFEWALRKKARAEKQSRELAAHMAHEMALLKAAFEKRIAEHERSAAFFADMIERGVMAMEPDSKGKRTVKTVAGTAYTRTTEHFEWPADDALVSWAKSHLPEAVKVKESPDKAALKAHVKATGELPEGLTVEPRVSVVIKET
jgi:hypothetical protein